MYIHAPVLKNGQLKAALSTYVHERGLYIVQDKVNGYGWVCLEFFGSSCMQGILVSWRLLMGLYEMLCILGTG